jgi:hypothetical protein
MQSENYWKSGRNNNGDKKNGERRYDTVSRTNVTIECHGTAFFEVNKRKKESYKKTERERERERVSELYI